MSSASMDARREAFALALVAGKSQSDAYREAVPQSAKWKPETIWNKACVMAKDAKVMARVSELRERVASDAILKIHDVLEETRRIMLSTPAGLVRVGEDGKPRIKLPHELDAATAACVSSFEVDDVGKIKYKFWDKNVSLERAAKILGLFQRDNEQKKSELGQLLSELSGNVFAPGSATDA